MRNRTPDPEPWNEIAWNGISFSKPVSWEIITIGRHYLMMGTPSHPRMELRWQDPPPPASRRPDSRKLVTRIRRQHLRAADAWEPDHEWRKALSAYETSGFRWKRPGRTGRGLIVSCPNCYQVSLIQFFQYADEPEDLKSIAPWVLASFQDHFNEANRKWAVFDVRAALPSDYQIQSFRFSAGFIEMEFACRGERLGLYRWSPASVLLSGKKLKDFAAALMPEPVRSAPPIGEDDTRLSWEESPAAGFWRQMTGLLPGRHPFLRFLVHHDVSTNRILGIKTESRSPMDAGRFNHICSGYEITAP